jgi:hypothetical protein
MFIQEQVSSDDIENKTTQNIDSRYTGRECREKKAS